jgi:hypothetical protein
MRPEAANHLLTSPKAPLTKRGDEGKISCTHLLFVKNFNHPRRTFCAVSLGQIDPDGPRHQHTFKVVPSGKPVLSGYFAGEPMRSLSFSRTLGSFCATSKMAEYSPTERP